MLRKGVKSLQASKLPTVSTELHTKPGSFKVQKICRLFASTVPKSQVLVNAEKSLQKSPVVPLPPLPENHELMRITRTDRRYSPMVLVLGAGAKHEYLEGTCEKYQDHCRINPARRVRSQPH